MNGAEWLRGVSFSHSDASHMQNFIPEFSTGIIMYGLLPRVNLKPLEVEHLK